MYRDECEKIRFMRRFTHVWIIFHCGINMNLEGGRKKIHKIVKVCVWIWTTVDWLPTYLCLSFLGESWCFRIPAGKEARAGWKRRKPTKSNGGFGMAPYLPTLLISRALYMLNSLTAMGLGGNVNPGACTFWVGMYPWREYKLGESSHFLSPYIHGNCIWHQK